MSAPANAIQYAGIGTVTADNYNTYVQVVYNYAALRTFTGLSNMVVCALGTVAPNDGGQGHFYFNSTSTSSDNNSTIIVPYSAAGQGAWLRLTGI
ncbi:MAG: hypothetical protein KGL39_05315 [Patescibacteria group bacterium]|nr:hypothetical protein [Patescibacteria group bacterium]